MKSLSILIADDHVVIRKGLRAVLETRPELRVVGEASDGREAIEKARSLQPDLIIADVTMPQLNGLDATPQMLKAAPNARVLILTMHHAEELIEQTLRVGASGYVLKSDAEQSLITAIEAVANGRKFFTSSVTSIVLGRIQAGAGKRAGQPGTARLTRREQEVVQLLAEGNSNKQVGNRLGISVRTAENHRARLMKKLGASSLSDLVRYAVRNKIIEP